MPTIKQKKAAEKLVENGGNVTKAMRDAKYSEATINSPSNLTESAGFKEIFAEHGLTEELIITALVYDIKNKKKNRHKELSLAAEITGIKKGSGGEGSVTNILNIFGDDQRARIAGRVLARSTGGEGASD